MNEDLRIASELDREGIAARFAAPVIVHYVCPKCPMCGEGKSLDLPLPAVQDWRAGSLVQDCFPDLPAADRERMITGICGPCWDKL